MDLKSLPTWLIALAMLIVSGFFGYAIIDNRQVDLWPPKIYPKQTPASAQESTKTLLYLQDFSDVLKKATEVVLKGENELWIAVDVPAYGAIGQPQEYDKYKSALSVASIRPNLAMNVLWFSPDYELKYNKLVGSLNDKQLQIAQTEGKKIRDLFMNAIVTNIPVLSIHNFWMSKDEKDKVRAVITWFALDSTCASRMMGIYLESNDIEPLLKGIWQMWKKQTNENFTKSLVESYAP